MHLPPHVREAAEIAPLAPESLAVIVGPTASGKTELALALARRLGGEIISADSRQVYRGLDAGTAKPPASAVPYHLIDCAEPSETFDAGRFAALARPLCEDIRRRGLMPIVAGGTGLYVKALLSGLCELPKRDELLRQRLAEEAARHGRERLHRRLSEVDPEASRRIPANNIQRVVRALEVYELTGRPISSLWSQTPAAAPPGTVVLSIEWPADVLRERIAARAALMWPGILAEVRALSNKFTGKEPGFQSLGYREAFQCLRGELSEELGLAKLTAATCAYAKRQRTWFRHQIQAQVIEGGEAEAMLRQALAGISPHEARAR